MTLLSFTGQRYAGSVEIGASGISVFAAPSDPDAEPGMAAVTIDPTPDEAEAIADRIWGWAEVMREALFMEVQLRLPGLDALGAMRNEKGTNAEYAGENQ